MGVREEGSLSQGLCLVGQVAWLDRGALPEPPPYTSPTPPSPLSAPPLIPTPTPSQVSQGVAMATDAGFGTQNLRAQSERLGGDMAEAETEPEEWKATRGCRKILQTLEGAIEQFKFHSR